MKCETDFQAEILRTKTHYHICQAESTRINPGIFDLNIADLDGKEHWVELKWKYLNKRKPKIRPSQVMWAKHRLPYNHSLWMITGSNEMAMMHHAQDMERLRSTPYKEWAKSAIWIVPINTFFVNINNLLADVFEERYRSKTIGVGDLEFL